MSKHKYQRKEGLDLCLVEDVCHLGEASGIERWNQIPLTVQLGHVLAVSISWISAAFISNWPARVFHWEPSLAAMSSICWLDTRLVCMLRPWGTQKGCDQVSMENLQSN